MYILTALLSSLYFLFNDTPTTEIYTLSLHDALPIFAEVAAQGDVSGGLHFLFFRTQDRNVRITGFSSPDLRDRKSTRLNSSHLGISYAVFCLKKKKQNILR